MIPRSLTHSSGMGMRLKDGQLEVTIYFHEVASYSIHSWTCS